MPNALFYSGQLLDGCSAAQRPALVAGLPAVCFREVRGQQRYGQGSSSASNQAEAQAVHQASPASSAEGCLLLPSAIGCCRMGHKQAAFLSAA